MLRRCLLALCLFGLVPVLTAAPAIGGKPTPVRAKPTRPAPDPADTEAAPAPPDEAPAPAAADAPTDGAADAPSSPTPGEKPAPPTGPPVASWLEAQVELSRRGFSCGSIDGLRGLQTVSALRAFQRDEGLRDSGDLDPATRQILRLTAPALVDHTLTPEEYARPKPMPATWLEKSQLPALEYASVLELVAELTRANPWFLRKINPRIDWNAIRPGTVIKVPDAGPFAVTAKAARIHISLAEHVLEAVDESGRILAHFPVSIARNVEKRPVGELHVTVVIPDPDYTLDPEVFPESEEMQQLGRKLILPPGPNNPVGVAWIGLDRPGYGMHGTPEPEKVGRTESHGCFRLANWDAQTLLAIAWVGLPVVVEP